MNHQAISEIFFVQEIELASMGRVELTRLLRAMCVDQLSGHLEGSLRVRHQGLTCHRFEARAGSAVATVTGWVERLGESDVVFRIVAAAASAEIVDVSMRFELVPAWHDVAVTAVDEEPMSTAGKANERETLAVRVARAAAVQ